MLWSDQIYSLPLDWFIIRKCLSFYLNTFGDISWIIGIPTLLMLKFQMIDALYKKWRFLFLGRDTKFLLFRLETVIFFARDVGALNLGNDPTRNFLPNPNRTEPNLRFFLPNRTEPNFCAYDLRSYQLKLIKMRAELANLNHCAIPFLSRAAVNLSLYNSSPVMKWIEFWRSVMSLQRK